MRNIFTFVLCLGLLIGHNSFAQNIAKTDTNPGTQASTGSAEKNENSNSLSQAYDIEDLKKKATEGDVDAQLNLGYIYLYGIDGNNVDYKQALTYYEMAAEQNSAVAYNNLGSLYFSGIGTDVDYPKAIHFFEEATKLGSYDAAVTLAIIQLGDTSHPKTAEEYEKILELLTMAEPENNIAKYLLGYSYMTGFLVKQNYKKAFSLIKASADDKYDEAQYILADFYINGWGTTKNYTQAVNSLSAAVQQGNADAMMKLADILSEGKIYKKDINRAHILYNVASVNGAQDAAQKRDQLEENLKIEDLLVIQAKAENYKPNPSDKTKFIRQTYGNSLKSYIDSNITKETLKK